MATAARTTATTKTTPDKTFTLAQEKVTKGAVKYGDTDGHNQYFRKEELTVEGHSGQFPKAVKVEVTFIW